MKKFKEKLIKWLGGFTNGEYHKLMEEESIPSINRLETVYSDTKSYSIDSDNLIFDKTILAQKIGERMLDNSLIDFTIKQRSDRYGSKIYEIRAKAYVGKIS